jgi:flagellar hook-basal body complex protein FliE
MPCSRCHTKIPLLSEAGQEFKNNGYSLEKKSQTPKEALPISEAGPAEPIVPSVAISKEVANEKSEDLSPLKTPSPPSIKPPPLSKLPPPPPKADKVYRLQSKDGSYIYTDNPLYANKEHSFVGTHSNSATSTKNSKGPLQAAKPGFSTVLKKNHSNITDNQNVSTKVSAELKKNDGLNTIAVRQPSTIAKTKPLNFEKCMESVLLKFDQPNSGSEAMVLFEQAERSCTRYAPPR